MKYNELQLKQQKAPKRVGRGIAAGQGKTAGRGTKGQGARKSGGVRPGFEGGQNPLYFRFPKLRGFTSHRTKPENVYTGQLEQFSGLVNNEALAKAGLVSNPYTSVKLITKGELSKKLTVKLQGASASAVKMIEKAGGSFATIARQGRPASKEKAQAKE
jgi:large subunit ribosomal protein L15